MTLDNGCSLTCAKRRQQVHELGALRSTPTTSEYVLGFAAFSFPQELLLSLLCKGKTMQSGSGFCIIFYFAADEMVKKPTSVKAYSDTF